MSIIADDPTTSRAKSLISSIISLAVKDAKKGSEEAKLWLYSEHCEELNLLLDAIDPQRFRERCEALVGLPKGYHALSPTAHAPTEPPTEPPKAPPTPTVKASLPLRKKPVIIEKVPVIDSSRTRWACQYAFKLLWALPTVMAERSPRTRLIRSPRSPITQLALAL